jgi:hypothetical protein
VIGSTVSNPSQPGEEENTGTGANRCSALKDMASSYPDQEYTVQVGVPDARSIRLTSPDGKVQKTVTLPNGIDRLEVAYAETVTGPLYIRVGASPNAFDLAMRGRAGVTSSYTPGSRYTVNNSAGGQVVVTLPVGVSYNPTPLNAGYQNRNLALTEEVEVFGDGNFAFWIGFDVNSVPAGISAWELF